MTCVDGKVEFLENICILRNSRNQLYQLHSLVSFFQLICIRAHISEYRHNKQIPGGVVDARQNINTTQEKRKTQHAEQKQETHETKAKQNRDTARTNTEPNKIKDNAKRSKHRTEQN